MNRHAIAEADDVRVGRTVVGHVWPVRVPTGRRWPFRWRHLWRASDQDGPLGMFRTRRKAVHTIKRRVADTWPYRRHP